MPTKFDWYEEAKREGGRPCYLPSLGRFCAFKIRKLPDRNRRYMYTCFGDFGMVNLFTRRKIERIVLAALHPNFFDRLRSALGIRDLVIGPPYVDDHLRPQILGCKACDSREPF